MMSALFLSTDTLDKPLEGYAAHRKTPPSTDSLTQRSYLTYNKTAAIPNGTATACKRHNRQDDLRSAEANIYPEMYARKPFCINALINCIKWCMDFKPYQGSTLRSVHFCEYSVSRDKILVSKVFQKVDSPHDSSHLDSMRRETSHIRASPRPNCRAKASTKVAKAGYGLMHQSLAAENSVFCTSPQAPPSPSG